MLLTRWLERNRWRRVGILLLVGHIDDLVLGIGIARWWRRFRAYPIVSFGLQLSGNILVSSSCSTTVMGHVTPILTTHDGIDLVLLNLDEARLLAMLGGVGDRSGTLPCGKRGEIRADMVHWKLKIPMGRSFAVFQVAARWGSSTSGERSHSINSVFTVSYSKCFRDVQSSCTKMLTTEYTCTRDTAQHFVNIGNCPSELTMRVMLLSQTHSLPNLH